MSWLFIDGSTTYTLDYRPKTVDYIFSSGVIKPKYNIVKLPMGRSNVDSFSHILTYPTFTLSWPIVTASLYADLSLLPLNKTIIMYDDVNEIQINIQIVNISITKLKTVRESELLRSVIINFRQVGA
jgi:hypothetical protein